GCCEPDRSAVREDHDDRPVLVGGRQVLEGAHHPVTCLGEGLPAAAAQVLTASHCGHDARFGACHVLEGAPGPAADVDLPQPGVDPGLVPGRTEEWCCRVPHPRQVAAGHTVDPGQG